MNFLKNSFQIRSDTKIYDPKNSSATGLVREKIKGVNNRNAFVDANILTGDFILQAFPDGNAAGQTDFLFDPFLASAKISQALDVNSPDFTPFYAVVNIPEITFLTTPPELGTDAAFNRKVREIVSILGVFKLYNFYGQFTVPNYGDPVQVTFKDMDTFSDPIFIGPLKTGKVNFAGGSGGQPGGGGGSYHDTCSNKPNVKTRVLRTKPAPPSIITGNKKTNKFITSLDQMNIPYPPKSYRTASTGGTTTGTEPSNTSAPYRVAIPKNFNKSKPANVFLYFHGNGGSGRLEDLITKGPSFIPDGRNVVLITPLMYKQKGLKAAKNPGSSTAGGKITVTQEFITEVLQAQVGEGFIGSANYDSLITFSHSGGGAPHGYFLRQLAEKNQFNNAISAARFLDSDYGFYSLRDLFKGLADGSIPKIDQSRITFLVGKPHGSNSPNKQATKGSGERWNNVYNSGTRLIVTNMDHMTCAYQIGPEYLIPGVQNVSAPSNKSKTDPNKQAEQTQQENLAKEAKAAEAAGDTGFAAEVAEASAGAAEDAQMDAEISKLKAIEAVSDKPKKPTQKKENSVTPDTKQNATPTDTQTDGQTCKFNGFASPGGPYPDDLQWVKMSSYGPRVWQISSTKRHGWGAKAMANFLKGLNNVKGGEDLGKGYLNPIGQSKGNFALPDDTKPGWWYGDVSLIRGGDTGKHKTHETGIGVDIALPTKYVDPSGKVFYGMCLRRRPKPKAAKSDWTPPPLAAAFWKLRKREHYDERALMDFFRYAIPRCERILLGEIGKKIFIELMYKFSRENKNGWSLTHPAYLQADWRGRTRGDGTRKDGSVRPKTWCKVYGEDQVHRDHFHIRLRTPGLAPGYFRNFPKDARPGKDTRKAVSGQKDGGNGIIDPGQAGDTGKQGSTY
mgnify:FL=1